MTGFIVIYCLYGVGSASISIRSSSSLPPSILIYSSPITLLFLQSLLIGLGALPLYWLAKEKLKNEFASISIVIAYLLYPAMHYVNLFAFHGIAIAIPLLLFTFYYLQMRAYKRFFLFAFLSILCKEQVSLIIL